MNRSYRPISLAAERAVRYLRDHDGAASSLDLATRVLATRAPDETCATQVLQAAFSGDSRLEYREGRWRLAATRDAKPDTPADRAPRREVAEPDRVLLFVEGAAQTPAVPFRLRSVSALRLQGHDVVAACGGDASQGTRGARLRRAILDTINGAVPVIHDPPGAIAALENWLGQPLPPPVSLRRLAQLRLGLRGQHDLPALTARLGLPWRDSEDPLELADILDACLQQLREPGERLHALRQKSNQGPGPIDWSRYAFDRSFLSEVPQGPGIYRFYDAEDKLIYVGKSKNLGRRLLSYFRETGLQRSSRVQRLLEALHRIEYEASGSDLEAMLREAEQIRRNRPAKNVQRNIREHRGRSARLLSILVLEPAEPPSVLRAFLIRDARLVGRVSIGPRGGGLPRIRRVLEDHFFSAPLGPTTLPGPDLDVEVVARWLAAHRDRVVAFDPTDLRTSQEVVERLRWFLDQGSPFDPDGTPVLRR